MDSLGCHASGVGHVESAVVMERRVVAAEFGVVVVVVVLDVVLVVLGLVWSQRKKVRRQRGWLALVFAVSVHCRRRHSGPIVSGCPSLFGGRFFCFPRAK